MDYEIVNIKPMNCSGISTQLTTSQDRNFNIIRRHWQNFNRILKINSVKQEKEWTKYGITRKVDRKYFYITAIPFANVIYDLDKINISGGNYCRFSHKGNMVQLKSTILQIYKQILPASGLNLNENRELIHYEQYDKRFNWNNPDSVIDIYVPFDSKTSKIL